MTDSRIACTLTPSDLRAKKNDLLPGLLRVAEHAEEVSNGYRYRFAASSETLQTIARVIDAERQCCRFFRFQLSVEPDLGPMWLEVTGPAGTRQFLADLDGV